MRAATRLAGNLPCASISSLCAVALKKLIYPPENDPSLPPQDTREYPNIMNMLFRMLCFVLLLPTRSGLLKNIDPILSADLLHVLRSMGHGDKLVICDVNFPAAEVASKTVSGKHIFLEGVDLPRAIDAVLSLMPLDLFVQVPAVYMAPQEGSEMPPAGEEVINESAQTILKHSGVSVQPLERFAFYEESRKAFAVVQTLERRPYGNVVLTKGVIGPDGKDLKP